MNQFRSLAVAVAMAVALTLAGFATNLSVVWAQAQSTPRPAPSGATGSAAATPATLPAEYREYASPFTTVRLDREVPVSMVLAASWEGLNAADAASYLNANFSRGGVDLPSRDVLTNRWPTPGDSRGLGPQNWVTPGQGGTVRAGVERLATLRDLIVANRPAPGRLAAFEAHLSSYRLVYVRDGSPPPAKPNLYSVVRRHAWQMGDPPTPQGMQVFEIESSADLAPDYDALSTATLGHTSAAPHGALFPNYVPDANRADGTWNTFTVKARARATLRIPRSHQRAIERACHALPRVPGVIASGNRVAMEDLKDQLDGVGTNPAASEELRAAVIAARRAIRNVTDRPLPREVLAVSAGNANALAWRQVAEREQGIGLLQRGEAIIQVMYFVVDPLNKEERKPSKFFPLVCLCLIALFVITVIASLGSHKRQSLFDGMVKQLDGLPKVDELVAAFAGYVGSDKDPEFASANPLPIAKATLSDKLTWLDAAFQRLVFKRLSNGAPVLVGDPLPFFTDLTGKRHDRSNANIDAVLRATNTAAFQRGVESVVIPTPSIPTFLDGEGEPVTIHDQAAFTAFETTTLAAGAASRDDEVQVLRTNEQTAGIKARNAEAGQKDAESRGKELLAALEEARIIDPVDPDQPHQHANVLDKITAAGLLIGEGIKMGRLLREMLGPQRFTDFLDGEPYALDDLRYGALVLSTRELVLFGETETDWTVWIWEKWAGKPPSSKPPPERVMTGRAALSLPPVRDFTGPISINPEHLVTTAQHDTICLDAHRRAAIHATVQRKIPTFVERMARRPGRTATRASSVPPGFVFHAGTGMLLPADLSESLVLAPPGDAE